MSLGERIKFLRKQLSLSQAELCEGICSQAFVSKIENDNIAPSAFTLYQLANRMGVDVSYLLDTTQNGRIDYVKEVYHQLRKLAEQREYSSISSLVSAEWNNPVFYKTRHKRILYWYRGVCEYFVKKNPESAFHFIDQALKLSETTSDVLDENDIEIILAKATILSEMKRYKESLDIYEKALKYYSLLPNVKDKYLKAKIYYNYGLTLRRNDDLHESLKYFKTAIFYCKDNYLFYTLGDVYFYTAQNYSDLKKVDLSIKHYKKAQIIYDLMDNVKLYEICESLIQELTSKKEFR